MYCGIEMQLVQPARIAKPDQHPEYLKMQVLMKRFLANGKLEKIIQSISSKDGKHIDTKKFGKLLKKSKKFFDIDGLTLYMLAILSNDDGELMLISKFRTILCGMIEIVEIQEQHGEVRANVI